MKKIYQQPEIELVTVEQLGQVMAGLSNREVHNAATDDPTQTNGPGMGGPDNEDEGAKQYRFFEDEVW